MWSNRYPFSETSPTFETPDPLLSVWRANKKCQPADDHSDGGAAGSWNRESLQCQSPSGRTVSIVQSPDVRLQAIWNASRDAIVCIDSDGAILDWNAGAESLFHWTRAAALGRSFAELLLPLELRDPFVENLKSFCDTGRLEPQPLRFSTIDQAGLQIRLELSLQPISLPDSIVFTAFLRSVPVQTVVQTPEPTVSNQRNDNTLLQQSLRQTFQQSLLSNPDQTFDEALKNCLKTMCEITGWPVGHAWVLDGSRGNLISADLWHMPHAEQYAESISLLQSVKLQRGEGLAGQIWETGKAAWSNDLPSDPALSRLHFAPEMRLKAAFGFPVMVHREIVAVLEFLSPSIITPDQQLLQWAETVESHLGRVLERRCWEEERRRLSAIVDSSHDAIIGQSLDGVIISWNAGAEQVYGYPPEEVIGQPGSIIVPDHLEHLEPELVCVVRHGIRLNQFETERRRKDGRIINVLMTVSPIYNAAGQIIGTSSIERDTTQRRQREEQLKQATRAAESATRTKNEFLANVSHELRTPMNAIIGMIDLTLAADELSPVVHEYLETAGESAHVLLSLLDDLLDFSRMEAGHFELDSQPFSLRQALDEAMRILALRAHERGIELACEVQADVPDRLEGDARRLRQVVMNLVGNSIKFTEQGEIVLQVSVEAMKGSDVQLLISVRDTGIGIALEDQERIFSPFTQADASTTRRFTGSGLGLSICRELIEQMHGRIWVESKLGRGSTFSCTPQFRILPEDPDDKNLMLRELRGLSVLIVDDNATNCQILESMLRNWAMLPEVIRDGKTALERIEHAISVGNPYALLIVDGLMPELDGFGLIQKLRDRNLSVGAKILMLSSADRNAFQDRCEKLQVDAYLEKPISQASLLDAIFKAVQGPRHAHGTGPGVAAPPQSLRILVAEDTPANQRVIRAILERRGHHVEIAHNGREAVDLQERNAFNAILMDVQMPTMDGFQATSAIRSLRKDIAVVPIIAMTAHAMRGDRERCLDAGMDGYISKPIDARQLVELVEKLSSEQRVTYQVPSGNAGSLQLQLQMQQAPNGFPRQQIASHPEATAAAPYARTLMSTPEFREELLHSSKQSSANPARPSNLDKPILNVASALARLGGDQALLCDMARFFLEDSAQLLSDLELALERDDAEEAHRNAHSLKGLAANFNAEPCMTVAQTIEDAAKQRKLDAARQRLSNLRAEVDRLVESLCREVLSDDPRKSRPQR